MDLALFFSLVAPIQRGKLISLLFFHFVLALGRVT
jgi:hypothetical protein